MKFTSNSNQEIFLKDFLRKIYNNKYLFLLSILGFVMLATLYIMMATPKYEVSTSLLIDSKGANRVLGESEHVAGGVGLIEVEKNMFNEVGIIKSFSLVNQTVVDLNFDVTYYYEDVFGDKEIYSYRPFNVNFDRNLVQMYDEPFEVTILSDSKFLLKVEANDFSVSVPGNMSTREIERNYEYEKEHAFGELIETEYFTFTLNKPDYKVNLEDFAAQDFSFQVHNSVDVTNNYLAVLDVTNIDIQASILEIVTTGPIVDKERDFLFKLTENYIGSELDARNEIALSKETFIRNQLNVISDSLSKFEVKLEEFKKDKKAVNLGTTASNALGQTNDLEIQAAKLRMDINFYNALIRSVESNRNSDEFVMPSGLGIDDPLINQNILDLKQLYAERSKKKFFVTSNNQEMRILNDQVQEATELLLNNLRSARQASQINLGSINSRMSNIDYQLSALPTTEIELVNIQRQSTLYENLFKYLSEELAKTGIARSESTSDTRVLDPARMVGDGPVSPQKSLLMALAVTLGLIFPLSKIVFFPDPEVIENLNQIVASSERPVIASIVHYDEKSDKKSSNDLDLWKQKESFRDLTAKLKLINPSGTGVIGLTSMMPEEGKTYNTINLGITLAESGKRVIILDADLRNPSLVGELKKIKGKGLASYLNGDIENFEEIIYSHEKVEDLKFIPTSVVDGNVHKLLSDQKMKDLVKYLKERFDYVILDTPAVGLVSDFLLLLDFMDINLFVVRRNSSTVNFLNDWENLLPKHKKKKSFIIFNDALKNTHKYGYGSKYGINEEERFVDQSLSI